MKADKINFQCYIEGDSGYSVLSRALIGLMNHAGLDIRVDNLHGYLVPQYASLQQKDPKDRFHLLHQIPTINPYTQGYYTVTEFNQPTYGSISILYKAQLVLTESNFCKKIFERFTDGEVHVIHYPLDSQYKPTGVKYKFTPEIEKFGFKFLSIFEWIMRKDPYTLLKAFCEEFSPDEDVCLILRCWSRYESPRKWIGLIAKNHNVFWLQENIANLPALYRACDCFVSTSMGEGFGHCGAEAMACGLKVIVPKSTGIMDYANKNNSILVDTKETEVRFTRSYSVAGNELDTERGHPFGLIKPWFKCWEPDFDKLKKAMRRAYENEMKFIKSNAPKIRKKFNFQHSLEQIKEAFEIES